MFKHRIALLLSALILATIVGCSGQDTQNSASAQPSSTPAQSPGANSSSTVGEASSQTTPSQTEPTATQESSTAPSTGETFSGLDSTATAGELIVQFGDNGTPFTMYLYDNSTAAAIADYVGTADWRLPIYNYDGYDNWEVMQYYDLPSRYEIPQSAETITAEKSGEVFYSEPNRIVLFYGDGQVTGEYSRVGYFEATEEFVSAVQNNPVLEGWGNKIVLIKD